MLQIDIDHFKRINDRYGHPAGDAVLKSVAHTLATSMRACDFAARTGGEEFVVAFASDQHAAAAALGNRLREAVASLPISAGGESIHCTISVGISAPVRCLEDWIAAAKQADEALYAAKNAGRDRVIVSEFATSAESPLIASVTALHAVA